MIAISQRAQQKCFVFHDRPARKAAGALRGNESGAKMWSLFAIGANMINNILLY